METEMTRIRASYVQLSKASPLEVVGVTLKETVKELFLKVAGVALCCYFSHITLLRYSGIFLNGLGSGTIALQIGQVVMYGAEKKLPDNKIRNGILKVAIVMKYTLPLLVALATTHLIYGPNLFLLSLVTIGSLINFHDYRKAIAESATK